MNLSKSKQGYTLVELLIVVAILSLTIGGTLLLFVHSIMSSEYAWDMTIATTHAEYILEEMQLRPSLVDITATDWDDWAEMQGLSVLPEERIKVEFEDVFADPLDVQVEVSWKRKDKDNKVELWTKVTK